MILEPIRDDRKPQCIARQRLTGPTVRDRSSRSLTARRDQDGRFPRDSSAGRRDNRHEPFPAPLGGKHSNTEPYARFKKSLRSASAIRPFSVPLLEQRGGMLRRKTKKPREWRERVESRPSRWEKVSCQLLDRYLCRQGDDSGLGFSTLHFLPSNLYSPQANRGDKIRTCDLCVPNAALYQAEPHPVEQDKTLSSVLPILCVPFTGG